MAGGAACGLDEGQHIRWAVDEHEHPSAVEGPPVSQDFFDAARWEAATPASEVDAYRGGVITWMKQKAVELSGARDEWVAEAPVKFAIS